MFIRDDLSPQMLKKYFQRVVVLFLQMVITTLLVYETLYMIMYILNESL